MPFNNDLIIHYEEKHGFGAMLPKAVLFDMDGVLYDSMPLHAVAWQKSMATFGIRMTAHDAYATEGARGIDTIRYMVKQQQGRDISEQEAQRMYDEKTRQFHQMTEAPVMPGVIALMRQITNQGLIIGVVTGSGQRPLIERLLTDFKPFVAENRIVTAYDVKRGKPYPDPYLQGLQKCGSLNPWEAVVIENAPLGIKAGVAAQIFTIGVNTGTLAEEELAREGADIILPDMQSLNKNWQQISNLWHSRKMTDGTYITMR